MASPLTALVDHSFQPSPPQAAPVTPDQSQLAAVLGDRRRLKALVRDAGWSPRDPVRAALWWSTVSAVNKDAASGNIYDDMVIEVFGEGAAAHNVTIPSFVDVTAMDHYHLSDQGVHVTKKVMCVLGRTCPDITYAPLLFPLASLLLHYVSEGECYNCLYGLVRARDAYVTQTKKAGEVTKYVLRDLARKYCKGWTSYLSKHGLQAEGILTNWLWWIFRNLPFTHLIRIVDCYLIEGSKILYRVALAILNLFYKHSIKSSKSGTTDGDLERAVSQFCEDIPVTAEKLLKLAFSIRGLSRKEIHKARVRSEMYVSSLRHAPLPHTIPKSESCESLNLKVSRSFSGPVLESDVIHAQQANNVRGRSNSHGHTGVAMVIKTNPSELITLSDWSAIWSWLPTRITLYTPHLLYTSNLHGTSLRTFFSRIDGHEPTLLVLKTDRQEILGAYCSDDWATRIGKQKQFFGTGESFVLTLAPRRHKYPWVGLTLQGATPAAASLFMRADNASLGVGGGGTLALSLDETLTAGSSGRSLTYDNEPLAAGGDFTAVCVEVFGFSNPE